MIHVSPNEEAVFGQTAEFKSSLYLLVCASGSSTLLLFTSGTNRGTGSSETDDAISPDQGASVSSSSSADKRLTAYKSAEFQPKPHPATYQRHTSQTARTWETSTALPTRSSIREERIHPDTGHLTCQSTGDRSPTGKQNMYMYIM